MNTAADRHPEPLHDALRLAHTGLKIVPIRPGSKRPPLVAWQKAATNQPEILTAWYTGPYADHGVGIVLGEQPDGTHLFAVDLDRHHPSSDGHETLRHLIDRYGELPPTVTSITGGDGTHLLYRAPAGEKILNQRSDAGRLGPGIDIRGENGLIVCAPTLHPSGVLYRWETGHAPWETAIADAPGWLLRLVTPTAPPQHAGDPFPTQGNATETPAERLRNRWDWEAELHRAGWQYHHSDPNGDQHWTRPGKPLRDGTSAVLHPGGPLVIFTTEIPDNLRQLGTPTRDGTGISITPFSFYSAHHHGGDTSAAARHLNQQDQPADPFDSLTASHTTPAPTNPSPPTADLDRTLLEQIIDWNRFWSTDHNAEEWIVEPIIAAHRAHALFAPGGTGKSLMSLWLAAKIAAGEPIFGNPTQPHRVLYLDYEMTADDLADRLQNIGIDQPERLANLHYALLPSIASADTPEGGAAICRLAELVDAQIVILDTFSRAVEGDENDADTVRAFYRHTGLGLKAAGRAFVRIDHAGKDLAKGQRGTSAKNDDVDIVWQMTATEQGVRLTAKKRRMGWVPDTVELTISDDPLEYKMAQRPGYPAGTGEAITLLEELDIDRTLSARQVGQVLRQQGHRLSNQILRAAVKARKTQIPSGLEPDQFGALRDLD